MIKLEISPQTSAVLQALSQYPELLKMALRQGVKATMRASKKIVREGLNRRYVRPAIGMKGLQTKTSGLSGTISSRNYRLGLEQFKHSRGSSGIFAQIVKGQGGTLRRAFIAKNAIWERVGRPRLPIRRLKSLAPAQHISSPPVSNFILQKLEQRLTREIENAI